jgi:hypothetical protein
MPPMPQGYSAHTAKHMRENRLDQGAQATKKPIKNGITDAF